MSIYYLEQATYEGGHQWSNGSKPVKNTHIQIMELIDDLYESAYVRAKDDPRLQSFLDQVEALRTYPLPYLANTTSHHLRDYFNENVIELELDELGHWVFHLRFYIHQHTHLIFNLYWREPSSTD